MISKIMVNGWADRQLKTEKIGATNYGKENKAK